MSAPRRENDPRRVVKIFNKGGYDRDYNSGFVSLQKGSYKLSDNSVVDADTDYDAQVNFREKGYNKGKAGDMAKNLSSRVEKSIPESSPASKNYDPTPQHQWQVTEPRGRSTEDMHRDATKQKYGI